MIVNLCAGKSEQQKHRLAKAVIEAVTSTSSYGDESVSVAIEEVAPERCEEVYKPDILGKRETIYETPGYAPLSSSTGQ
jgi:4-oxalocrotonate tautomerase